MYRETFKRLAIEATYEAVDVEPDRLEERVDQLVRSGFSGFNVTVPYKEAVIKLLDSLDPAAEKIGAVNTIAIKQNKLHGFNTDAYGALRLIELYREQIDGRAILLIGAGGSARAVLYTLLAAFQPSHITIITRTMSRALDLVERFRSLSPNVPLRSIAASREAFKQEVDVASVVVNTSPVGMYPRVEDSPVPDDIHFRSDQAVIDLIYTPRETKLLRRAAAAGARTIGGLEMLLHQGARACEIWTGAQMPIDHLRPRLLEALSQREQSHTVSSSPDE